MDLTNITKTDLLKGRRCIITGCGYKKLENIFYDPVTKKPCHNEILVDGDLMKLNIGAATAYILAANGATVHMVSTTEKNYLIYNRILLKK